MPRNLDDKRRFAAATASEARALSIALADALITKMNARPNPGTMVLHGVIEEKGLSVSSPSSSKLDMAGVHSLFAEADHEALDPTRIYISMINDFSPEITLNWMKDYGSQVDVIVRTTEVGWGHEVLDLSERVARSVSKAGYPTLTPAVAPSASASVPAPPVGVSGSVTTRKRRSFSKPVWGFIFTIVGAVIAGGILKALGWV